MAEIAEEVTMHEARSSPENDYSPRAATPLDARLRLLSDSSLGMGNFLDRVRSIHPAPDLPFLWVCRPGGKAAEAEPLSLRKLTEIRDSYASWYHEAGVGKGDPVGVYLDDEIGFFLHYLALSALGAIPALINGRMDADIAAAYMKSIGSVGVVADSDRLTRLDDSGAMPAPLRFRATPERMPRSGASTRLPAIYPYQHADADPVMLCHTSGTTGVPKAATFAHRQFFLGKRNRLVEFPQADENRMLTALPQAHSAGISYLMTATLLGLPTLVVADHSGEAVREAAREFSPTLVVAFPQTYVELAGADLSNTGLDDVHTWINTGDSAHEAHIRALVRHGRRPDGSGFRPGSRFIDGLGSSEMGMALFRKVSEPESGDYGRCVGTPIEIVEEMAVLDDDGHELPPGEPGRLGVRTPTITPGYWNDSELTARSSFAGYWLTGDVVYRDHKGRVFHLDRVPDVIHTASGPVYSLPLEEVVLGCPGIDDCSVFGVEDPGSDFSLPVATVRLGSGAPEFSDLNRLVNDALATRGLTRLAEVIVAEGEEDLPVGPTGKVLKRRLRERFAQILIARTERSAS